RDRKRPPDLPLHPNRVVRARGQTVAAANTRLVDYLQQRLRVAAGDGDRVRRAHPDAGQARDTPLSVDPEIHGRGPAFDAWECTSIAIYATDLAPVNRVSRANSRQPKLWSECQTKRTCRSGHDLDPAPRARGKGPS